MTIDVSASLLQETMKTSATTSSSAPSTAVNFNNKNKNRNQDDNNDSDNNDNDSSSSTDAEFTMVTASEAALNAETANMSKILSAVSENEGATEIELGVTICKLPIRNSDKEKEKERK